ncbi:MAG TPA: hypothetical protein VFW75_14195 [Acetobacteraceae bacterium]|nr:hypothetical protein [Acetobacteraceae bacterium]
MVATFPLLHLVEAEFAALPEQDDEFIAPSALGAMVYAAIETTESARILLSEEALATLRRSKDVEREQYNFILSRISNPILRRQHMHRIRGSDLLYWKPGRTRERAGYFIQNGSIDICELTPHEYSGCSRKNFDADEFVSYYPGAGDVPETEDDLIGSWAQRLETAAIDLARAQEDHQAPEILLEESSLECDRARQERDDLQQKLDESRTTCKGLRRELETYKASFAAAEAKVFELERPWWKRLLRYR